MLEIEFANQQKLPVETDLLARLADRILSDHGFANGELSIALVDDPSIRALNQQYLNHDWETDVISFVLEDDASSLTGQLIVSTDTAYRLAEETGVSPQAELALYVAHGTLHLVGFDDLTEEDATKMRAAEEEYLTLFSIECSGREN